MQHIRDAILLTPKEYETLKDASLVRIKPAEAKAAVDAMIIATGYPCGKFDCYCHGCPLTKLLGEEIAMAFCDREQEWAK